jgi:hypothetical protein
MFLAAPLGANAAHSLNAKALKQRFNFYLIVT